MRVASVTQIPHLSHQCCALPYGKKWGVKVGEVELPDVEEAGRKMWSIDVTPEMKESVMGGQPLFSVRSNRTTETENAGRYAIREAEPLTDEKITSYDEANGTEMRRFIDFMNRGRRLQSDESGFFHVGNTGELLNSFGIEGRITIGTKSVNPSRHTQNADHQLTADEWFAAIQSINTPLAITKYTKQNANNQFRIYTEIQSGDKVICLGANVNQVGRDVRLTNIRSGYKRKLEKALTGEFESLLYPTRQELTRMIEQSSYENNSSIYAEPNASNVSAGEVTENIRNEQENGVESSSNNAEIAENAKFSVAGLRGMENLDKTRGTSTMLTVGLSIESRTGVPAQHLRKKQVLPEQRATRVKCCGSKRYDHYATR